MRMWQIIGQPANNPGPSANMTRTTSTVVGVALLELLGGESSCVRHGLRSFMERRKVRKGDGECLIEVPDSSAAPIGRRGEIGASIVCCCSSFATPASNNSGKCWPLWTAAFHSIAAS
eukprot:3729238-Amphidinium_carterae.1